MWPSTRRPWPPRAACSRRVQPHGYVAKAGARVTTNVFVRDLDMGVPNALDGRRLEVVADGLPLHGGAQLAIDTTMVSPLHADGTPHRLAATIDGAACVDARRRKERTYLNSLHRGAEQSWLFLRLKLVVVGQLSHWLSSAFLPGPRPGARPASCANVWNRLGG